MDASGWTVSWVMLALAALTVLAVALPSRSARRSRWLWLFACMSVLAALASNAYDYRLFAALFLMGLACLAVHIWLVWQERSPGTPDA